MDTVSHIQMRQMENNLHNSGLLKRLISAEVCRDRAISTELALITFCALSRPIPNGFRFVWDRPAKNIPFLALIYAYKMQIDRLNVCLDR